MLFYPFVFSGLNLKNRLVRSAAYEKRADKDGFVTESLIEFYEDIVRGGVGLVITGSALVHPSGITVPQMIGIHNDIYIEGLRKLTCAVHRLGGVITIQLVHGGRQSFPILLEGNSPIAPSSVYDPSTNIMPREMTEAEIWEVIKAFVEAGRRAKIAGFDAVQIHGAHGYLISQFLSPHTNRRNDHWGGDEERRFRFLEEIVKEMRKVVGEDYPIMIKMNADDMVEGGLTDAEAVRIAVKLEKIGIDAIEVSGGMYESRLTTELPDIVSEEQEAYFRSKGKKFKKNLKIPVMLVGGIRSRSVIEDVLHNREADMISLGRPLIREPDLPNKLREGKVKADCKSCDGCLQLEKLDVVKCIQLR